MVKVLLIVPPALPLDERLTDRKNMPAIPYGPLSIATYLKHNADVDARILDVHAEFKLHSYSISNGIRAFIEEVFNGWFGADADFQPDVVGISAIFNTNYIYLKDMAELIKLTFPETLSVVGGGLPSNLPDKVLQVSECIDAICFGEGEIPMLELINANDKRKYIDDSSAWITKKKLTNGFIPKDRVVAELDSIPTIDMEMVGFENYQEGVQFHGNIENRRFMLLYTSSGCPYRCSYCASGKLHGKEIRFFSAERVLSDVDYFINKYGVNSFIMIDDHFLFDRQRALKILNGLSKRNVTVEFANGLATNCIDDEIAQAFYDAGIRIVQIAVESGSQHVLKLMHKPLKLDQVRNAVKILRKYDFYIRAFFVPGMPGEKEEHRQETIDFIKEVGFDWCAFNIATPIAGSELYEICEKNGYLINTDFGGYSFDKGNISTEDYSAAEIEEFQRWINYSLNFINNYNVLNGKYNRALSGFEDVIRRVPDHALAHYMSAICYKKMEDEVSSKKFMNTVKNILATSEYWKNYFNLFQIEVN